MVVIFATKSVNVACFTGLRQTSVAEIHSRNSLGYTECRVAVDFCWCNFAIFATLLIHTNGRNYFAHFVKREKKIIPRRILLFSGNVPLK